METSNTDFPKTSMKRFSAVNPFYSSCPRGQFYVSAFKSTTQQRKNDHMTSNILPRRKVFKRPTLVPSIHGMNFQSAAFPYKSSTAEDGLCVTPNLSTIPSNTDVPCSSRSLSYVNSESNKKAASVKINGSTYLPLSASRNVGASAVSSEIVAKSIAKSVISNNGKSKKRSCENSAGNNGKSQKLHSDDSVSMIEACLNLSVTAASNNSTTGSSKELQKDIAIIMPQEEVKKCLKNNQSACNSFFNLGVFGPPQKKLPKKDDVIIAAANGDREIPENSLKQNHSAVIISCVNDNIIDSNDKKVIVCDTKNDNKGCRKTSNTQSDIVKPDDKSVERLKRQLPNNLSFPGQPPVSFTPAASVITSNPQHQVNPNMLLESLTTLTPTTMTNNFNELCSSGNADKFGESLNLFGYPFEDSNANTVFNTITSNVLPKEDETPAVALNKQDSSLLLQSSRSLPPQPATFAIYSNRHDNFNFPLQSYIPGTTRITDIINQLDPSCNICRFVSTTFIEQNRLLNAAVSSNMQQIDDETLITTSKSPDLDPTVYPYVKALHSCTSSICSEINSDIVQPKITSFENFINATMHNNFFTNHH